ncbi:dimethylaniline monooxygenase [Apiospora saccharicola]
MAEKRVAVIGAGVSGITAAKRLRAEGLHVRVFERALGPGGVWSYSCNANAPFATPMYDPLETNYPRELMGVEVEYGTEKRDSEDKTPIEFDAVVICMGTFDKPFMPEHEGLAEWEKAYTDSVLHSKTFRNKLTVSLQNVLIIGVGPSGSDIADKLSKVAKTVGQSTRGDKERTKNTKIKPVGPIKKLNHKTGAVEIEIGEDLTQIDKIIYCTGYNYSHSFLRKGIRAKELLHDDGMRIDNLWKHMFWIEEPSLVFIGITKDNPTFLIAQAQAAYAARVLAGNASISAKAAMRRDLAADLEKRKEAKLSIKDKAHNMRGDWSKEYIETLRERCKKDEKAMKCKIVSGNEPFIWTERIDWVMKNRQALRKAYVEKACLRKNYPTPESLGFRQCPKCSEKK